MITIIVLLILAGASLSLIMGEEGMIGRTIDAKEAIENAEEKELVELAVSSARIDGDGTITISNLNKALKEMFHNDKEAIENEEGWEYQGNKSYIIYQNGKVEETENVEKILPDEYQQVEYIESTGPQYIDTKVATISGYRIKTTINISDWNNANVCYFAGFLNQNIYRDYTVIYQYKPMLGMLTDVQSSTICSLNTWYDIDASTISQNGYFRLDGNELVTASNTVSHDSYNIWIFGVNYYDTGKFWNCYAKMKETQIYDSNNTLVRNFIPCYSTATVIDVNGKECPNKTIGMYDTVEGKFYTNQGSGTFEKGNNL